MAEPLLSVEHLRKSFGALAATDDLSLEVLPGEIHAVIGPNGAGKTTLIGQLFGELQPDSGRILFQGRDIAREPVHERAHRGIARSYQITSIYLGFTALDNVAMAIQARAGHSFHFWRNARKDPALRDPARAALAEVGLAGRADMPARALAHGERRQLELAMALASAPALLLLDEPMAGMGPEESQRMVEVLRRLKGRVTMLLVEHDMDAVFQLADRITVLVYGRAIATGAPEAIRRNAEVREAYLGAEA
jgi:branched-chain amino acid transport system ATP-binding protein